MSATDIAVNQEIVQLLIGHEIWKRSIVCGPIRFSLLDDVRISNGFAVITRT